MFSGLLSTVPLFWKVPVLLVFVLLLMFVLILVAGYRVRLPFFLGDISPAPRQPTAPAQSLAAEIQQLKNLLAEPGVRRASQPSLQRQGSIVEEVDMVDCQLDEEEGEEMTLRRRCLSLTQLETRTMSSSLPSSPLGTPLKSRLLGTPTKSSPKGTSKRTATTPVRRPILTPVRSNPALLTPVRNIKRDEIPVSYNEDGGNVEQSVKMYTLDPGKGEEDARLQEEGFQSPFENQNTVADPAQCRNHGEKALDLRVGFGSKGDLPGGGVLIGVGEETDVEDHQSSHKEPLPLDRREPEYETVVSMSSTQWMEDRSMCSTDSPRKTLVVAGDPQSPITTSFGWIEGGLEEGSTLAGEKLRVESLLLDTKLEGGGSLEVSEREEVVISRSSDFLDKVEGMFNRSEEKNE